MYMYMYVHFFFSLRHYLLRSHPCTTSSGPHIQLLKRPFRYNYTYTWQSAYMYIYIHTIIFSGLRQHNIIYSAVFRKWWEGGQNWTWSILIFISLLLFSLYVSQHLEEVFIPDGVMKVTKMLSHRPIDWQSCVRLARLKFEKYFHHKVCSNSVLLHPVPTTLPKIMSSYINCSCSDACVYLVSCLTIFEYNREK